MDIWNSEKIIHHFKGGDLSFRMKHSHSHDFWAIIGSKTVRHNFMVAQLDE